MIRCKKDLRRFLCEDRKVLSKNGRKKPRFFGDEIWKHVIVLRKYEYYLNCTSNFLMKRLLKFKLHYSSLRLGIFIHPNNFGEGLWIEHCGGIVVNPKARIGKKCILHQNVTIGNNSIIDEAPIIGDNVLIGAGAIIIGNISIGNNCVIGAGTVVTKSLPDNCKVVGSKNRIL